MRKKKLGGKHLTQEEAKQKIEEKGYQLLSEFTGVHNKVTVQCPEGHVYDIVYKNLMNSNHCHLCFHPRRLSYKQVQNCFLDKDCELLESIYENNKQKLKFRCKKCGFVGYVSLLNFMNDEYYCDCTGFKRYTFEDVKNYVISRGYELLSDKKQYKNVSSYIKLKCPKGHIYKVKFYVFKQGYDCKTCAYDKLRGENSPHWNGNLSLEQRNKDRNYPEYTEWQKAVYKKYNYRCIICNSNKKINAHHLVGYNDNANLRTVLSNGVCMCEKCHRLFHSMYGQKNNTPFQFLAFKNNQIRQQQYIK